MELAAAVAVAGEEGEMELSAAGEGGGEDLVSVLGFPFWVAARRRFKSDDPFFAAGNMERELLAKQVALDLTEEERYRLRKMVDADTHAVSCPIIGCRAHLNSLEDFEDHYHARHAASCSVCSRVYPTSRLLSIHVSEAHDSFFQAKVARGFPMYECLVEGCGVKLKSYRRRQQHLVDKHKFPKSFEFFRKARPSKHHRQRHRKHAGSRREGRRDSDMDVDKKPSKAVHQRYQPKQVDGIGMKETESEVVALARQDGRQEAKETEVEVDEKMDDLVSAVSKLSASDTPSCIRFGHRRAGGFAFVPRSVPQNRKLTAQPDAKG